MPRRRRLKRQSARSKFEFGPPTEDYGHAQYIWACLGLPDSESESGYHRLSALSEGGRESGYHRRRTLMPVFRLFSSRRCAAFEYKCPPRRSASAAAVTV